MRAARGLLRGEAEVVQQIAPKGKRREGSGVCVEEYVLYSIQGRQARFLSQHLLCLTLLPAASTISTSHSFLGEYLGIQIHLDHCQLVLHLDQLHPRRPPRFHPRIQIVLSDLSLSLVCH